MIEYCWWFEQCENDDDDDANICMSYDTYAEAVSAWMLNLHTKRNKEVYLSRMVTDGNWNHFQGEPAISSVNAHLTGYQLPETFEPDSAGFRHAIPPRFHAEVEKLHAARWRPAYERILELTEDDISNLKHVRDGNPICMSRTGSDPRKFGHLVTAGYIELVEGKLFQFGDNLCRLTEKGLKALEE